MPSPRTLAEKRGRVIDPQSQIAWKPVNREAAMLVAQAPWYHRPLPTPDPDVGTGASVAPEKLSSRPTWTDVLTAKEAQQLQAPLSKEAKRQREINQVAARAQALWEKVDSINDPDLREAYAISLLDS
jgi:hypothetical protein